MKKILSLIFAWTLLSAPAPAWAQWTPVSQALPEAGIRLLTVDPKDSKLFYAASDQRVYKSTDGGASWKQIMALRGSDKRVTFLYADPFDANRIYVATTNGIRQSVEGGKRWTEFFSGAGGLSKSVYSIAPDRQNPDKLWLGTADGLVSLHRDGSHLQIVQGIPKTAVYSVLTQKKLPAVVLAATGKEIYKSGDGGKRWEKVPVKLAETGEEASGEEALQQFNVEEMITSVRPPHLIFLERPQKFYAAGMSGVYESEAGDNWSALVDAGSPRNVNQLTSSLQTFYLATDRGVFQWDGAEGRFKDFSDGLESKEVNSLFYDAPSDALFAGTPKGLFHHAHPEFDGKALMTAAGELDRTLIINHPHDVMRLFEKEPSIHEIQNAAIQYAEVHPRKIQQWRQAAAKKAWFPTVSFNRSFSNDQNIDLDRGGTNDPDRFIMGPEESSEDWSVGASWNLGELIWNDDQTSIDTRSRLLVELRDDILTETTHLYYERRRLQVDLILSPPMDVARRVQSEIKLQELTAGIDALTGGYLSERLTTANP